MTILSDERLMAFVDGELAPDEATAIQAAADDDPALAARIDRQRRLERLIAGAHADALAEPVPARLTAAARSASVIDLAARRVRRWAMLTPLAMAAGLALGFFLGGRMTATPLVRSSDVGLVAGGALETALDGQLAADQAGKSVKIGISFRARDGRYCRTFRIQDVAGLACRGAQAWAPMVIAAAPAEPLGVYTLAASPMPAAVAGAVDQAIQGAPLDAAQEAAARAGGWRNSLNRQ